MSWFYECMQNEQVYVLLFSCFAISHSSPVYDFKF
jgi:hypothetical protein